MFFLISFACHIAASFGFLLAILTPNWLTVQTTTSVGNITVQRGIFYVCDLIAQNDKYQTTRCLSIIDLDPTLDGTNRWNYNLAISSASVAIGCAAFSVIVLWLAGVYFNAPKKTNCTACILLSTSLLLIVTFLASITVWILIIAETLVLGYKVDRSIFNWPMWLAVGTSGGYLIAFILMLISFCKSVCRRRRRENLYYPSNQY